VNKLLRTLWTIWRARRRPKLDVLEVGVLKLRVRPTDADILNHMNNGVYLSVMDFGRFDLMIRSGMWDTMRGRGWYPVGANVTISYRKSLPTWTRYELHTRLVGADEKALFVEQRFVVDGEIYARGVFRGVFLEKGAGVVTVARLGEAAGVDFSTLETPDWLVRWAADVALPSTRAESPNVWA